MISNNPNLYNAAFPSATIVGSISAPGDVNGVSSDVDYYAITLQAGQQLILDVDINPANGLDSFLALYGPGGAFIGDNDDLISPDPGSGTQFGHNTDSQIIYRAAQAGTYYFAIKAFADDQGPQSKGDYTLNVSINSTPATAAQIMAEDVQALVSGASWNHTQSHLRLSDARKLLSLGLRGGHAGEPVRGVQRAADDGDARSAAAGRECLGPHLCREYHAGQL